MNWLEIAAIGMVLLGVGAAGFLVAQRPSFWWGIATVAVQTGIKAALPYLLKRLPSEKEEEMRRCLRSGGEWDHIRKRCKK